MKQRKTYWRRKGRKIIAEGQSNKKTIYLFQLPDPKKVLNSSLLSEEKKAKIRQILDSLDYKQNNNKKKSKNYSQ